MACDSYHAATSTNTFYHCSVRLKFLTVATAQINANLSRAVVKIFMLWSGSMQKVGQQVQNLVNKRFESRQHGHETQQVREKL